jgi:hypothetical protein
LAQAHLWNRMLHVGRYGLVSGLSTAEKLDRGYLGLLRMLTLLAPDIVEAIMDGRQPADFGVLVLQEGFRRSGEAARGAHAAELLAPVQL